MGMLALHHNPSIWVLIENGPFKLMTKSINTFLIALISDSINDFLIQIERILEKYNNLILAKCTNLIN